MEDRIGIIEDVYKRQVHLMVTEPIRYVKEFAKCGAVIITVHLEACEDVKAKMCIRDRDYEAFYEEEIRYRTMMGYPPAENLLAV